MRIINDFKCLFYISFTKCQSSLVQRTLNAGKKQNVRHFFGQLNVFYLKFLLFIAKIYFFRYFTHLISSEIYGANEKKDKHFKTDSVRNI